jgi:hypothetical protein
MKLPSRLVITSLLALSAACSNVSNSATPIPQAFSYSNAVGDNRQMEGLGSGAIARGVLVSNGDGSAKDSTGTPIPNARVGLSEWTLGAAIHWQTVTDSRGRFTIHAAPGTYMLIIAPPADALAGGLYYATVHDKVLLAAGTHVLVAPTLPPYHNVQQTPVEQSGKYRLTALGSQDVPCYLDAQMWRSKRGWPSIVIDEWLTENNLQLMKTNGSGPDLGFPALHQDFSGVRLTPAELCRGVAQDDQRGKFSYGVSPKMVLYTISMRLFRRVGQTNPYRAIAREPAMLDPRGNVVHPHSPVWP